MPTMGTLPGSSPMRFDTRTSLDSLPAEPLLSIRCVPEAGPVGSVAATGSLSAYQSAVHSDTFPSVSDNSHALGSFVFVSDLMSLGLHCSLSYQATLSISP